MADYRVNIHNRTYKVTIEDDQLMIDGERVSFDLELLDEKNLHVLRKPNQHTEAIMKAGENGHYQIQIGGAYLNAQVTSGSAPAQRNPFAEEGKIHSPMPGLIVDVLVTIGDHVKKGQTILVQEAMKMQMKLKAPASGVIRSISTSPGERVEKGTLLVSLAASR